MKLKILNRVNYPGLKSDTSVANYLYCMCRTASRGSIPKTKSFLDMHKPSQFQPEPVQDVLKIIFLKGEFICFCEIFLWYKMEKIDLFLDREGSILHRLAALSSSIPYLEKLKEVCTENHSLWKNQGGEVPIFIAGKKTIVARLRSFGYV